MYALNIIYLRSAPLRSSKRTASSRLSPPKGVHTCRRPISRQASSNASSSCHPSLTPQRVCCTASCPIEATARAAAKVGWPEVPVRPGLKCGRGGGGASSVTAQFDVRLRGLDVIDHGAELVDETHQSHVDTLADGLAGYGEVAVKGVVVAPVEVMEGERSCSGALWCTGRLLHHHCVQAERLDEQGRLKLQWRKVHHALPSNI